MSNEGCMLDLPKIVDSYTYTHLEELVDIEYINLKAYSQKEIREIAEKMGITNCPDNKCPCMNIRRLLSHMDLTYYSYAKRGEQGEIPEVTLLEYFKKFNDKNYALDLIDKYRLRYKLPELEHVAYEQLLHDLEIHEEREEYVYKGKTLSSKDIKDIASELKIVGRNTLSPLSLFKEIYDMVYDDKYDLSYNHPHLYDNILLKFKDYKVDTYACDVIGLDLTLEELREIALMLNIKDVNNMLHRELCTEISKHINIKTSTWENIKDAIYEGRWCAVSYYLDKIKKRTSARRVIYRQRENKPYSQRLAEWIFHE